MQKEHRTALLNLRDGNLTRATAPMIMHNANELEALGYIKKGDGGKYHLTEKAHSEL